MIASSLEKTGLTSELFEGFIESRQEPDWVTEQRRAAWKQFQEMSWPGRREEEWSRTDIRLFKADAFRFPGVVESEPGSSMQQLLTEGVTLAGSARACNSVSAESQLDAAWAKKGVICCSLEEATRSHESLVRRYLAAPNGHCYADRFDALRASAWSGGGFFYIPRGVVVDQPLYSLSTLRNGGADFGHILVVLEEGAEGSVLAETESETASATGMHCGAVDLHVGPGAHLRFVSLQNWGSGTWHFARQKAIVRRDAQLQWTIGALGGRLAKVNQHVMLVEPGAECQVNGVMFTEDRQHFSYHTLQHHQAPHCKSDFLYKAALQDQSRTVWRGMIKVDVGAQKTNGYQRNDNLLLSAQARADSIPGLEIEADDVRCTHGSTSGRVDEELIFYAQARGYSRQEAIRMIVTGFFQQVFDRITIDSVRDSLGRAIALRVREYE